MVLDGRTPPWILRPFSVVSLITSPFGGGPLLAEVFSQQRRGFVIYFTNRRILGPGTSRCLLPLIRSSETFGFVFVDRILFVHRLFTKDVPVDPSPGGVVDWLHEGTAQEGCAQPFEDGAGSR